MVDRGVRGGFNYYHCKSVVTSHSSLIFNLLYFKTRFLDSVMDKMKEI